MRASLIKIFAGAVSRELTAQFKLHNVSALRKETFSRGSALYDWKVDGGTCNVAARDWR